MTNPIRNSQDEQIGFRDGDAVFDLNGKKRYELDASLNLLDPVTKEIVGHLLNTEESGAKTVEADNLFS